jgi:hypothetical protein
MLKAYKHGLSDTALFDLMLLYKLFRCLVYLKQGTCFFYML